MPFHYQAMIKIQIALAESEDQKYYSEYRADQNGDHTRNHNAALFVERASVWRCDPAKA